MAYRFVHRDFEHQNNGLPAAKIDPSIYPPDHEMHCHSWALSVFSSQSAAEEKYNKSIRARPQLAAKVGDHIAKCHLLEDDGVCTAPTKSGHFSFFESESFDFCSRFEMVGAIARAGD